MQLFHQILLIRIVKLRIVALRRLNLLSSDTVRVLLLFVLLVRVMAAFELLHLILSHLTEALCRVSFTSIVTWYKTSIVIFTLISGSRGDRSLRSLRLLYSALF